MKNFSKFIAVAAALIIGLSFGADAQTDASYVDYPASMVSGTIPVIYINTENSAPIVDKVNPIPAGFYMEPNGYKDYEAVGSAEKPVELTIRGRGNATWLDLKKPYKLKFNKKTSLFGLPKSKHYALMSHLGDQYASNVMVFEMARVLGMPWAPHVVPVELVLNGQYEGTYFLQETIKIDSGRLNIFEQEEGETDPSIIPYGWLLEIDNYEDEFQHRFQETPDGPIIRFTHKSPEVLSDAQRDWLYNELELINGLIYNSALDNPEWIKKIDVRSAAKYFIAREIMQDYDGYNGSFYIYKDKADDALWQFGPMWDCGVGPLKNDYICFSADRPGYASYHWMGRIMAYPCFTEAFQKEWKEFYTPENLQHIENYLHEYCNGLEAAFAKNAERWRGILKDWQLNIVGNKYTPLTLLKNNSAWIDTHQNLSEYVAGVDVVASSNKLFQYTGDTLIFSESTVGRIVDASGRIVGQNLTGTFDVSALDRGIYIISALTSAGENATTKILKY